MGKNLKCLLFAPAIFLVNQASWLRAETVMLAVSGGYHFPADSNYKKVYGSKIMIPEFKLGIRVLNDIYIYGNFFSFSKQGLTPDLKESASSGQRFLGGGLAYFPNLNKHWKIFVGAVAMAIFYKEEAMETNVSDNKGGFSVEGGLYFEQKFFLIGVNGAYTFASSSYRGVDFKIGGARTLVLLGLLF